MSSKGIVDFYGNVSQVVVGNVIEVARQCNIVNLTIDGWSTEFQVLTKLQRQDPNSIIKTSIDSASTPSLGVYHVSLSNFGAASNRALFFKESMETMSLKLPEVSEGNESQKIAAEITSDIADELTDDEDDDEGLSQWLLETRRFITHRTQLSVLYHRKRERFYSLLDRWGKAGSLIAGTAAFSSLLVTADSKAIAGLMVALATMPGLVFAWNDKARIHAELAQKFALIEAEVIADGWDNLTSKKFDLWLSRIMTIESTEPLIMFNLLTLCENQIAMLKLDPAETAELSTWQKWTANWLDLPSKK
ncbi:hypothetical protein IGS61_04555 [Janthinobacterium sp. FW305-129]|uniref:hypothetical protein n=1 Tax=Janthinobacterium sp. FW305-129 TaxID=2775054 RepID=UPI001E35105E|nr:hypothetical protein [Janthinobacterium sp. FW305-129]MCC7596744.1 hypothetical protein [Janthinobacterium sp. FW305-129]